MLSKTTLDPNLSIPHLAALTEGRSGSDLKELCREAAMRPLREEIREKGFEAVKGGDEVSPHASFRPTRVSGRDAQLTRGSMGQTFELRPLKLEDFFELAEDGISNGRHTTNSGDDYSLNLD